MRLNFYQMKLKITLLLSFIIFSCNPHLEETINEDYDSLFPFQGIDKPDISYDEMKSQLCDPELAVDKFEYPGVNINPSREYTVTFRCVFKEGDNFDSKYIIRYVDADKKIKTIGTNNSDVTLNHKLKSGVEKVISFKVRSGFPMYLGVDGVGARNSSVNASVSAVSTDGYITTPALITSQNQNKEGPNRVEHPYCEYIILP